MWAVGICIAPLKILPKVFYTTGGQELLVVLSADVFDWVFVTGSLPPVTAPHGFRAG